MKRLAIQGALLISCIGVAYGDDTMDLEATMADLARELSVIQRGVEMRLGYQHAFAVAPRLRLTGKSVPVYEGANKSTPVAARLPAGLAMPIIDKAGDWYAVAVDIPGEDLKSGWVHASEAVPEPRGVIPTGRAADMLHEWVLGQVRDLREKYQNNEFVRITGFSLDVGLPPAVSIAFEFK